MGAVVVCAVAVTLAAALLVVTPRAGRLMAATEPPATGSRRVMTALAIVGGVVVTLLVAGPLAGYAAFLIAGTELAITAGWLLARGLTERRGLTNERLVTRACSMIAGQLDAGEIPSKALLSTAEDVHLLLPAAGAVHIGGDVPAELRRLGQRPGCAGLAWLAHGWQLSETTGMPLSPVTRRIADRLRQESDIRDQRRAELATAKSTSRLLACLPLLGLGMGFLVDADPLTFLTATLAGHLCLVGAATLICAGLIWTNHLSREER